jgi:surfeit locus 1 family protein
LKKLWVPAVSTVIMLAILIGLGVWQLQRRDWKNALLAQIAAAERNPPVALSPGLPPFAKVRIAGTLQPDLLARYGAEVRADTLGSHVIVPLLRDGADPVMVDLGWAPDQPRQKLIFPAGAVTGYMRPAEHPGAFSAKDDPAKRLFYTLDPVAIGRALGLARVAPFTLVAMGPSVPGHFPDPVQTLPRPPDNHLQYALTWFGFAVTLLIIFILYARKSLRA